MKKGRKEASAKIISTVTAPPVLSSILMLVLYFADIGVFDSAGELVLSVVLLGIVPALAYPVCRAEPQILKGGRGTRQELEIILLLAGSSAMWIAGLITDCNDKLMLMLTVYFFASILLAVSNELLHVGTSSHALCITAPIIVSCFFLGVESIAAGVILYIAIIRASACVESHSKEEYALGLAICALACAPAELFCLMI